MNALFADLRMKNEKQIRVVFLSGCASDCSPNDRRLFAVSHWIPMDARIAEPKMKG